MSPEEEQRFRALYEQWYGFQPTAAEVAAWVWPRDGEKRAQGKTKLRHIMSKLKGILTYRRIRSAAVAAAGTSVTLSLAAIAVTMICDATGVTQRPGRWVAVGGIGAILDTTTGDVWVWKSNVTLGGDGWQERQRPTLGPTWVNPPQMR